MSTTRRAPRAPQQPVRHYVRDAVLVALGVVLLAAVLSVLGLFGDVAQGHANGVIDNLVTSGLVLVGVRVWPRRVE